MLKFAEIATDRGADWQGWRELRACGAEIALWFLTGDRVSLFGTVSDAPANCEERIHMRKAFFFGALVGLGLTGTALYHYPTPTAPAPLGIVFPEYGPQKVVYHITAGAGWLGSEHLQRLRSMGNHVRALPKDGSDLRVVLQGAGLDLLIAARKTPALALEIDQLKQKGVQFVVCANTLVMRKLDVERDLYGVARADIVKGGVVEAARLQTAGYVYLKI